MPPIQPITKKRIADTALAPAPRREMKIRKLTDVLGFPTSQLFLAHNSDSTFPASSHSSSTSDPSPSVSGTTIALPPSSPTVPAISPTKTVKKNTGKYAAASKKGKEKETDFEHMEEDM